MSITKEQILDAVAKMSIMDITGLISMMEDKFGVSASATAVAANPSTDEKIEDQTEFNVILTAIGGNKVSVIKQVRSATGLGLKEAKDLVESAPVTLKENLNKDDAETLRKSLEEVGASVEVK